MKHASEGLSFGFETPGQTSPERWKLKFGMLGETVPTIASSPSIDVDSETRR